MKQTNSQGFTHLVLLVAVVAISVIVGVFVLVSNHANLQLNSTDRSSAFSPSFQDVDGYDNLPIVAVIQENSNVVVHKNGKRVKDKSNNVTAWMSSPTASDKLVWSSPTLKRKSKNVVQYYSCLRMRALLPNTHADLTLSTSIGDAANSAPKMPNVLIKQSATYGSYCMPFVTSSTGNNYNYTATVRSGKLLIDKLYTRRLCTIPKTVSAECKFDGK